MSIKQLRHDYINPPLKDGNMPDNPFLAFDRWFEDERDASVKHPLDSYEVNAMVIATGNKTPSARVVLLKDYSKKGFTFFTNYNSRKGRDIENNNNVALLFYWIFTMRQVRIEGRVYKTEEEESEAYFNSRPLLNRISSALSKQSEPLENKAEFDNNISRLLANKENIVRPPHWGGYIVKPHYFEFWQGNTGRTHDRFAYSKKEISPGEIDEVSWEITRLYP